MKASLRSASLSMRITRLAEADQSTTAPPGRQSYRAWFQCLTTTRIAGQRYDWDVESRLALADVGAATSGIMTIFVHDPVCEIRRDERNAHVL